METGYNPEKLVYGYRKLAHGKARASAIRYAINQADINNDIPYMVFFREELCYESSWFVDELDVVTVFPELLSLSDRYPDIKCTRFQPGNNIQADILDMYGHLLDACLSFYQISFEDCINFYNDYKKRLVASGHSPREAYHTFMEFYLETGHMENARKFLKKTNAIPPSQYDCVACSTVTEIKYYLLNNEKEKADKLAEKIKDGTLRCKGSLSDSLLRLKQQYLKYYILHGNYDKAAEEAYILERSGSEAKVHNRWASFMCAYASQKPGRGLRIYKKHWKDWEDENDQYERYYAFKDAACFFRYIKKDKETIKFDAGKMFPLYNESCVYSTEELCNYYYKGAEDTAKKFDKRNGTDKFINELVLSFANAFAGNSSIGAE